MKGQLIRYFLPIGLLFFTACGENPVGKDFKAITQEIDLQNFKGKFGLLEVPGRNASDLIEIEKIENGEYALSKVIAAVQTNPDEKSGAINATLEQDMKTPGKLDDGDKLTYKVHNKSQTSSSSPFKASAHVELAESYSHAGKALQAKSEVTLLQKLNSNDTSKTSIAQKGVKVKDKIIVADFFKKGTKFGRSSFKLRSSELRITSLENGFSLWLLNIVGKNKTVVRLDYIKKTKVDEPTDTPEVTTADPAPEVILDPAPEVTTTDPAPEVTTTDPAPEVTTTDPAPEVTTTDPAPEVTTTDPSSEATTTVPAPEATATTP